MPRSIGSCTITFGLVNIPVQLFTSATSRGVEFKMLTPKGNKVKQKYTDEVTGEELTQADCDKGYEISKNEFIRITKDELKALQAECEAKTCDIVEFVDAASVDNIAVEKTYYLGPNGAEKGYALLSSAMAAKNKIAVAQWNARGKEHLVTIRPYRGGLVLQQMFYSNEVNPFDEIRPTATAPVSEAEQKMAGMLIDSLATDSFDTTKYVDHYVARVKAAIEEKVAAGAGGTFKTASAEAPKEAKVVDLASLLAASLEKKAPKK